MNRPAARIPRRLALQLCALCLICLWPYALYQPWYLSALAAVLLGWRFILAWHDRPGPGQAVAISAGILCAGLVFYAYGIPVGRQPGLSALCLLLPLKLLETRRIRDVRAALLLAFFLITGLFLHEQSALIALAACLATLATLSAAALTQRPHIPLKAAARQGASLLALGAPLMLALFVLFPRIDGPLWGLPLDAYSSTGLSEQMRAGSFGRLIQSGDIAFRASFSGPLPPERDRYWRGPVLTHFDGSEWLPRPLPTRESPAYTGNGRQWDYSITLEPSNLRWLPSLDYATASDLGRYRPDFALITREPIRQRTRYTVRSHPDLLVGRDDDFVTRRLALALPDDFDPRTRAEGARIKASHFDEAERLQAALQFMRQRRLQYTLDAPATGRHSTDDFLFDTRRGFCEHFSAAFVILMRAAGVPARVVTGYQGGEPNPVDGTLVIRQADAHAWAEVWLPQRGWQRIDPTAKSYPQRLSANGLQQSLPPGEALNVPFVLRSDLSWLRDLRYRWEALGNAWNQWVLGYNAQRQAELLRRLGLPRTDWQMLTALMASAAGLWLGWLTWQHRARAPRRDALDRLWARLCKRLARAGLPRQPWEGAHDYLQRASAHWPAQAATLHDIARQYTRLRYGPPQPPAEQALAITALQQRLQSLRP